MAHTLVNEHLEKVTKYFYRCKLKLNLEKSITINFNKNHKYLRVFLDQKLNCNYKLNSVKRKTLAASNTLYPYTYREVFVTYRSSIGKPFVKQLPL